MDDDGTGEPRDEHAPVPSDGIILSMPMTKEQILAEALALDPADRDDLADQLWRSVDRANGQSIEESWAQEADDRIAAHQRGELPARPMDKVVERLRNRRR